MNSSPLQYMCLVSRLVISQVSGPTPGSGEGWAFTIVFYHYCIFILPHTKHNLGQSWSDGY